jgi:predicted dehydrogenase
MRFALLGIDEDVKLLRRLIANAPTHEIFTVPTADWESLIARTDYDAVVVARSSDELLHTEQLKKLVATGAPVVASHPAADVLTAYELEMIRREGGGLLIPWAREWNHPAWDRLMDLLRQAPGSSSIGRPEQISFERFMADRRRPAVQTQFAQDIDVLRRLLGTVTSVNAVGTTRDDQSWSSLTVHFTGENSCTATWSLTAPGSPAQSRVHVVGDRGTETVVIPDDLETEWEFRDSVGHHHSLSGWNIASAVVEQVQKARQGHSSKPSWEDACLDLEIAETAEKSLRRKRAIDLYTSERSEEKTFKGFMAATGCLVLVAILFAFLGLALWEGFRGPFREVAAPASMESGANASRDARPGWPMWIRMWPVYPLLAFLLLQFLLLITRPKQGGGISFNRDPEEPPKLPSHK